MRRQRVLRLMLSLNGQSSFGSLRRCGMRDNGVHCYEKSWNTRSGCNYQQFLQQE